MEGEEGWKRRVGSGRRGRMEEKGREWIERKDGKCKALLLIDA